MHLLLETSAGYALFNVSEKKLNKITDWKAFEESNEVMSTVKLSAFKEFKDLADGMKAGAKMIHGKLSVNLKKFLRSNLPEDSKLLISEKRLGREIAEALEIDVDSSSKVGDLCRAVRLSIFSLLPQLSEPELKNMSLGLAHGLGRFKIKFSADKVDTMVIQAIGLQQDLDKELNNYLMRLKEWYGYHFPELTAILGDGLVYAKAVREIGNKKNSRHANLSEILNDDLIHDINNASDMSCGIDISDVDIEYINNLCDQIIELDEYRSSLNEYLKSRMLAVSPNLTEVVGEVISAKLIAKAGSLVNLAKLPASTLQILGAEKALFKAMKSKKNTPKYGIIYQAKLVANSTGKAKGKIARALASKCSLCVRVDALNEEDEENDFKIGENSRKYLEKKLDYLEKEEKNNTGISNKISKGPSGNTGSFNKNNNFKKDFNVSKPKFVKKLH